MTRLKTVRLCGTEYMRFSKIYAEDIESVISDKAVPWKKFCGSGVIITGVAGLIGKAARLRWVN
ncbi:MAG: hypothetical protein LBB94_10385 [Clostridiales bacterium]|nr:hypothetical protein [Clostridiales bacterium]